MKKYIISLLLLIVFVELFSTEEDVIKDRVSLYFSESIRSPIDSKNPIDHEITFSLQYNDNIESYYRQERDNGVFSREYSLALQQRVYRNFYISGFRSKSPYEDIWSIDAKYLVGTDWHNHSDAWKTFIGVSNCWDTKHGIKILLEEKKSINLDVFIIPTEIIIGVKTMSDFKRLYHEESVRAKFSISLPLSWRLRKYIKTHLSFMVKSVDYGKYRWQQKLMFGIDLVK